MGTSVQTSSPRHATQTHDCAEASAVGESGTSQPEGATTPGLQADGMEASRSAGTCLQPSALDRRTQLPEGPTAVGEAGGGRLETTADYLDRIRQADWFPAHLEAIGEGSLTPPVTTGDSEKREQVRWKRILQAPDEDKAGLLVEHFEINNAKALQSLGHDPADPVVYGKLLTFWSDYWEKLPETVPQVEPFVPHVMDAIATLRARYVDNG